MSICISDKFPGDVDAASLGTDPLRTIMLKCRMEENGKNAFMLEGFPGFFLKNSE